MYKFVCQAFSEALRLERGKQAENNFAKANKEMAPTSSEGKKTTTKEENTRSSHIVSDVLQMEVENANMNAKRNNESHCVRFCRRKFQCLLLFILLTITILELCRALFEKISNSTLNSIIETIVPLMADRFNRTKEESSKKFNNSLYST